MKLTESGREKVIRSIISGSETELPGGVTENVIDDAVRFMAGRAGMKASEWVLSMLIGSDHAAKPEAKAKGKKARFENVEAPGDAEVTDEALVELLRAEAFYAGTTSKEWSLEAVKQLGISKGGFYVRLEKLVARKAVLVEEGSEDRVVFGRPVIAKVKIYYHPEEINELDPAKYERLMGVARG